MDITQQYFENELKRNRAWRRKVNYLHRGRDCRNTSTLWKPEKDWKLLWNRSLKRSRSKQLRIEYPRISSAKDENKHNMIFGRLLIEQPFYL